MPIHKKEPSKKNKNSSSDCKSIYIIEEYNIQGFKISKPFENYKTYLKSFLTPKIRDKQELVKPKLQENPDQIIVYVGKNGLTSNKNSEQTRESIIGIATSSKSDTSMS